MYVVDIPSGDNESVQEEYFFCGSDHVDPLERDVRPKERRFCDDVRFKVTWSR